MQELISLATLALKVWIGVTIIGGIIDVAVFICAWKDGY